MAKMNLEKQTLIFKDGELYEIIGNVEPTIFFNELQWTIIEKGLKEGTYKEGDVLQPLGDIAIMVGEEKKNGN